MKTNDLDVVAREGFEPLTPSETKDLPRNSSAVADIADSEASPRYKSDTKRRVMPNHELLRFLRQCKACEPSIEWLESRDSDQMWADCERPDWLMWWASMVEVPMDRLMLVCRNVACAMPLEFTSRARWLDAFNANPSHPLGFMRTIRSIYISTCPEFVAQMCGIIRQHLPYCPIPEGWGQEK